MKIIKNPNLKRYEDITKAVEKNDGYCPCKLEHIEENKCICEQFKSQAEGECECGRFVKIDNGTNVNVEGVFLSTLKKIVDIAERAGMEDDDTLEFTYIIGSCFPQVYQNIMNTISDEYFRGFKEGFDNGRNFSN